LFSLVAVDLASGVRRIVSDPSTGNGPRFGPRAVALDGERALVLATNVDVPDEDDHLALFAVDLASGDRSIVSDEFTGEGRPFFEPRDIALAGNLAFLTDWVELIAVDLETGDRTIVSGPSRGQGGLPYEYVRGLVLDGNRAIVAANSDTNFGLMAVDLASGDRSIVSNEFTGQGPMFRETQDLVLDGDRVLALSRGVLFAVDLATGDRTILPDSSTGLAIYLDRLATSGDRLYATNYLLGAIVALDPRTGQRVIVAR